MKVGMKEYVLFSVSSSEFGQHSGKLICTALTFINLIKTLIHGINHCFYTHTKVKAGVRQNMPGA